METPEQLQSDPGSNFECLVLVELCRFFCILKSRTTADHSQGNGQLEWINGSLEALLKTFLERKTTQDLGVPIPHCLLAYRATVHTSFRHYPHGVTTRQELRTPVDNLAIDFCESSIRW
ncbi:hypothetical protein PHET_10783 [Paragonimus heterotremus]|uniref:Integrase catalytic domain-containing protein n=1 Tax=Paragonimus heterotremus TaxID=100268 RepID=A0A8J4SJN4_9TREM|nr:hypothetical protein PHET_10783 [Paragonimus heterotremus]